MASDLRDDALDGTGPDDTYASSSRWRHQESSSYRQHAAPRDPAPRRSSQALADFFNSDRVKPPPSVGSPTSSKHKPLAVAGTQHTEVVGDGSGILEVKCGPLLNYRRMENETWFGSVLIVTRGGGLYDRPPPVLVMKIGKAGPSLDVGIDKTHEEPYGTVNGVDYSNFQDPTVTESSNGTKENLEGEKVVATKLYSDPDNTFWRFDLQIHMQDYEVRCNYNIPGLTFVGEKTDKQSFFIPAKADSMRIMFHSCNGFSVGTDEAAWSGPCLWNDVMRVHSKTPFHIM
jgi:hypothetical protein